MQQHALNVPWKHYAKWTKPDTKGQMLYNSTYMEFLECADLYVQREVPTLGKKQIWEASKKGKGSYCLMGAEIPLGWYKNYRNRC